MRQQIGCIIFYISIALGFLALLVPQIYWFIKCYTEGGDWKYYGKKHSDWCVACHACTCITFSI